MPDIQEHKFNRNVTSVEPNIYGYNPAIERGEISKLPDSMFETNVVELYTDKDYISISKKDVKALCDHFGIRI